MPAELIYVLPSRVDLSRAEQRQSYPGIMDVNLAECHDALYDFRRSARGPFRSYLRTTAERICENAGTILIEVPMLLTLPNLEARIECIDGCFEVVDDIRRTLWFEGNGPFAGFFRKRGDALCASLRKLLWQAHDEWCWRS